MASRPGGGRRCTARSASSRNARRSTPYLTGLGFARLNAQLQGLPDPDAAAARAIATVDLTDAADRPIGTYSKGMRQRAKLAGALVHDPRVLLLDEPFNGLDPRQRLHMMALLRSMAAEGRTILFSSHILEEVERVADSVLVVYAGRLAAAGDFRSIRRLMTDRPAHVHGRPRPTTGGSPRPCSPIRRSSAPSWSAADWRSGPPTTTGSRGRCRRSPGRTR